MSTPTAEQARQLAEQIADEVYGTEPDTTKIVLRRCLSDRIEAALTAASAAQEADLQQLRQEVAAYGVRFGRLHNESAEDHAASIANIIGQREARLTAQEAEIKAAWSALYPNGVTSDAQEEGLPECIRILVGAHEAVRKEVRQQEAEIARLSGALRRVVAVAEEIERSAIERCVSVTNIASKALGASHD